MFQKTVEHDRSYPHMSDYSIELDDDDMVIFRNRGTIQQIENQSTDNRSWTRRPATNEMARLAAPGWYIYNLEQEWRNALETPSRDPDAAFLGFRKKRND